MKTSTRQLALLLLCATLTACDNPNDETAKTPDMPRFNQPEMSKGRTTWMGTCRNCHLLGVAGAPAVTHFDAWKPRIAKGKTHLYQSALKGINDTAGKVRMPARGGNTRLSDEQVKRAVDYMLASVQHFNERR